MCSAFGEPPPFDGVMREEPASASGATTSSASPARSAGSAKRRLVMPSWLRTAAHSNRADQAGRCPYELSGPRLSRGGRSGAAKRGLPLLPEGEHALDEIVAPR